jgi:hypothetical protein
MKSNHLASEFKMVYIRLFESGLNYSQNSLCTYTRNGEHNSCVWLFGHIGYIADSMILRPWGEHEKHSLITDANFGFSSKNGKQNPIIGMSDVVNQVKSIFRIGMMKLSEDNAEYFLSSRSSIPQHCQSDIHLVVHGIQDIAYHCGQIGFILTGKTCR